MESVYDVTLGTRKDSMHERRAISFKIDRADRLVDGSVDEKDLSGKHEQYQISTRWMVNQLKTLAQCNADFLHSEMCTCQINNVLPISLL